MIKQKPIKTKDIENEIVSLYDMRKHDIVPRVGWGLNIHECDLLILSKSGYATEVEIKISSGDLKKDADKNHKHSSRRIKELYFAIPLKLLKFRHFIPKHAGIYIIYWDRYKLKCRKMRNAKINRDAIKFSPELRYKLARLGLMRYWNQRLKETNTWDFDQGEGI